MASAINKPQYIESPVRNSGNMGATGQLANTFGGGQAFSRMSGIVASTLLASGPGRLDSIGWLTNLVSGQGVVFYDSAIATSGGPYQTSGHNVLGFLPPTVNTAAGLASGLGNALCPYPYFNQPGAPFVNGLCAGIIPGTVSGTGGFYGTFTLAGLLSGQGGSAGLASVPTLLPSP
jgi:hypothetical protein